MSPSAQVHPTAVIDKGARIGAGARVWHFCHVMKGARIGAGCILGQNVFVGRGVPIGAGTKIQNNVSLYEGVRVGKACFVGPSVVFTNVRAPRAPVPVEEMKVPVDFVAGTSMGSIVGGLYASGMSPEEIETAFGAYDWVNVFKNDLDREDLSFRRKRDDDFLLVTRWLLDDVPAAGDPVANLARAFLHQSVATAVRYEPDGSRKGEFLIETVRKRAAEGVIFASPSFCDPALLDRPMLARALTRAAIPYISFKYAENSGQMQPIREQAGTFADSIKLWSEA